MAGTDGPTSGTTAPSLPPVKMHALDRSSKDTQAANDGARAAAQSTILINGGAATAILAYLSKDSYPDPSILSAASVSLIFYALGVLCGAVSMWYASQALAEFALSWEMVLYDDDDSKKAKEDYRKKGDDLVSRHRRFFGASVASFLIATGVIAMAFLAQG
jgi:hypothetical protein